jgi:hypothetical protein
MLGSCALEAPLMDGKAKPQPDPQPGDQKTRTNESQGKQVGMRKSKAKIRK